MYNELSVLRLWHSDDKKFDSLSFELTYSYLLNFYDNLEKLIKMKSRNLAKKEKKCIIQCVNYILNSFKITMMNMMNYWMLKYYPFQKSNLKFKPINSKLKDYDHDG